MKILSLEVLEVIGEMRTPNSKTKANFMLNYKALQTVEGKLKAAL